MHLKMRCKLRVKFLYEFFSSIHIKPLDVPISYRDKILLMGSCFTEHIGNHLAEIKFNVLQNPNGILFDALSVCSSLQSYINNHRYQQSDLVYINESWHSWQHHSRFSHTEQQQCLQAINNSQQQAHTFCNRHNG